MFGVYEVRGNCWRHEPRSCTKGVAAPAEAENVCCRPTPGTTISLDTNSETRHTSQAYSYSSTNIVRRFIRKVNTRRRNSRRANCAAWNSLPDGTCVYADFARVRRSCRDYWPFKKHRSHCRLAAEIAATLITSRSTQSRSVRKTSSNAESSRIRDNTCLLCLHGVSSRLN